MLTLDDESISHHVNANAKAFAPLFSPRGAATSEYPAAHWPGDAMFWRVKLEMLLVAPTSPSLPSADEIKSSLPSPTAMDDLNRIALPASGMLCGTFCGSSFI